MKPSLVFLIGYRGSGKTATGRALAKRLGWAYVDCDRRLEDDAKATIPEVFRDFGEEGFRDREERVLESLIAELASSGAPAVIATGGGVVLREANVRRMRSAGKIVWLTASPETLRERIVRDASGNVRPPLQGSSAAGEVEAVLRIREPLYRGAAEITVDTEGRSPQEVAVEILDKLELS